MKIKATIIDHAQGSKAWLAHRARSLNASDLAAAMGLSKYKTRAQLIAEKATGIAPEVNADTQRRFDRGHEYEAAARPIAEEEIGEALYPCVLAAEVEGLPLSASLDGTDLMQEVTWEHKSASSALVASLEAGVIPEEYHPQMEQGLMLSGASRCLFSASNGDRETMRSVWYESNPQLRAKIIPTWKQFLADVAAYQPTAATVKPIGATPETLPALRIEVTGSVLATNLDAFRDHALQVIGAINTNLQTDQDFADAEATVKWCKGVEEKLDAAWEGALAQTASIDALRRTVEDVKAEVKRKRLELDKLVTAQKDAIRTEIVMAARTALCQHVADLNATLPKPAAVPVPGADFAGAIKGKRSVDSIRDTVAALLANAKAEATQTALRVRANLDAFNLLAADRVSLFPDLAALALKSAEDFAALVQGRLAQHEAERERLRADEAARIEARARLEREAQAARQAAAVPPPALVVTPAPAVVPQTTPAVTLPKDEPATLPLGKLCERLGFTVTADFLGELGFQAHRDRSARLYRESDFPRICQGLIQHLQFVQQAEALAA